MGLLSFPVDLTSTLIPVDAQTEPPSFAHLPEIGGVNAGVFVPPDGSRPYGISVALLPEAATPTASWSEKYVPMRTSDWDGAMNTHAILRADPENVIARHIAALQIGEHRDYYWPARLEVDHIFKAMGDLVLAAIEGYAVWTSTQAEGSAFAWYQGFDDGDQFYDPKSAALRAVAVRRFSI